MCLIVLAVIVSCYIELNISFANMLDAKSLSVSTSPTNGASVHVKLKTQQSMGHGSSKEDELPKIPELNTSQFSIGLYVEPLIHNLVSGIPLVNAAP
jgi:hypothetical protein